MTTLRTYDLDFIARRMAGQLSAAEDAQLCEEAALSFIRQHKTADRRARQITTEIASLKREMEEHCRNPHGNGRCTDLIHFDLTVLLAERDRLSRAVPGLDQTLLEQLADDYDAEDATKISNVGTAEQSTHIKLPDDVDPSAVADMVASALGAKAD